MQQLIHDMVPDWVRKYALPYMLGLEDNKFNYSSNFFHDIIQNWSQIYAS